PRLCKVPPNNGPPTLTKLNCDWSATLMRPARLSKLPIACRNQIDFSCLTVLSRRLPVRQHLEPAFAKQLAQIAFDPLGRRLAAGAPSAVAPAATAPSCPICAKAMVRRTAKRGANAGSAFWGCSGYPSCKGTRPLG
ncbi:MAG: topoisomerase DNA-binding C4 zinc finger domain-containing protein, partial [Rubrivivax sp.]|nr:topoisomerase DNA-binding C4 zinc finger domain-containing protein [Rubrivivax sp.]